jgi:hypothetical protein
MPIRSVICGKYQNQFGKSLFYFSISQLTYLNVNIGGILNNPENKAIYSSLLNKIAVAIAKRVALLMMLLVIIKTRKNSKRRDFIDAPRFIGW